jgi:hypothetical protein
LKACDGEQEEMLDIERFDWFVTLGEEGSPTGAYATRASIVSHTLTKEGIGTRYVLVIVRMLVDPANPQDVQQVHALQDALEVSQQSPGIFHIPNWDEASLKKVRAALLQLGETISDTRRMFGVNDQVDPLRHLLGTAWRQSREGRPLPPGHAGPQ